MKLIELTGDYKCEWESLISEFRENNEVIDYGKITQRYWIQL